MKTSLNKPASLGWTTKILKKWEGAGDEQRPGQAMKEDGRLRLRESRDLQQDLRARLAAGEIAEGGQSCQEEVYGSQDPPMRGLQQPPWWLLREVHGG